MVIILSLNTFKKGTNMKDSKISIKTILAILGIFVFLAATITLGRLSACKHVSKVVFKPPKSVTNKMMKKYETFEMDPKDLHAWLEESSSDKYVKEYEELSKEILKNE